MVIIGVIIILITIYFLIKQYDTRMVLVVSGLLMCAIAGAPMKAFAAFAERMTTSALIQAICSVMGFAFVMKVTECDKHLIHMFSKWLMKLRPVLIIGTIAATFAINTAMPSAAGVGAAVGPIFIPLLIAAGISPVMAASTILAGTFGCMLSPGLSHNAVVAKIAGVPVMEVIAFHYKTSIIAALIGAICLTAVAYLLKEDGRLPSAVKAAEDAREQEIVKVNIFKAIVPLIPITLLVVGAMGFFKITIPAAMLTGSFLGVAIACAADRSMISKAFFEKSTKAFFDGMANGFGSILGIVIAASVFVQGMTDLGVIKAATDYMLESKSIVKYASFFGPFILAVISGSGDAAGFAFNESITPHAKNFGFEIVNMGSLAVLGAQLGRTMSPIAGITVILSGIAGVSPLEVAKRNIPGMIIAGLFCIYMLG